MEIILTLSVLTALVALGVTTSLGNERQRQAIQTVREQLQDWTEQDIRLKREKLAREINVPDAKQWLQENAAKVIGKQMPVLSVENWNKDGNSALIAICQDGTRLVFTPLQRNLFLKALQRPDSKISKADPGPLGSQPKKTPFYELSIINVGMFFDLEAQLVWRELAGQILPGSRLWMYVVEDYKG